MSFARFWDVIDDILSFCNAFEVWLCICWWHKTIWKKQWSNSDETVMQQWCLWFRLCCVIFKDLRCHWSFFGPLAMHLKCDYASAGYKRPTAKKSDQTVIIFKDLRCHWSFFILLQCIWSVIMHLLVTQDLLLKKSDQTVMEQWCLNSDATVIQQSCRWFELFFVPLI
jgi:hypothetical protein